MLLRDTEIVAYSTLPTGYNMAIGAKKAFKEALKKSKLSFADFDFVLSTGYGRHGVDFSNKAVSEIICHATALNFLFPSVRSIIDIGGQDSKTISVDADGNVVNFAMNDKCAAGTGRFIEVIAHVLQVPLEDMGRLSLKSKKRCHISSTCTVFAETEVVSLRAQGARRVDLIAGIHRAMASRVVLLGRATGFDKDVAFTGGVAKNIGMKKALEEIIGMKIVIPQEPQITGALGAALIARNKGEPTDSSTGRP